MCTTLLKCNFNNPVKQEKRVMGKIKEATATLIVKTINEDFDSFF